MPASTARTTLPRNISTVTDMAEISPGKSPSGSTRLPGRNRAIRMASAIRIRPVMMTALWPIRKPVSSATIRLVRLGNTRSTWLRSACVIGIMASPISPALRGNRNITAAMCTAISSVARRS